MPVQRRSSVSGGRIYTAYFDLHENRMAIHTDNPEIAAAIEARLYSFFTSKLDTVDFTFEIFAVEGGQPHWVEKPQGEARALFEPDRIEILYFEATDQLYIAYEDRVVVLSDLEQGRTRISIQQSEVGNIWLVTHPLFTLPLLEHLKRLSRFRLHAASLCLNGRGLLLSGQSGSGKSTLALALLRDGFGFMGDDTVLLVPCPDGLEMLAFPEEIDVTDTTVSMFPELQDFLASRKLPGASKWQVSVEAAYGTNFAYTCRPAVLVFPQIVETQTSEIWPIDETEALMEVLSNVLPTDPKTTQQHLNTLGQLTSSCTCYKLKFGRDLHAVSEMMRKLLT